MHVVVVEDAPELLLLFRYILERERDIQVTTYGDNFDRLWETVDWSSVDVVVVDNQLGRYNGTNLLSWLSDYYPSIRRIMLTGDVAIRRAEAHADLVLYKPVDASVLMHSVRG